MPSALNPTLTENYEYFAGCDDLINAILDKVREDGMKELDEAEALRLAGVL